MLDNNILFFGSSLIGLIYNIYSRIKNVHVLKLLIDDSKKNVIEANRIGLLYKIKFVLYTLLSMISVGFLVLNCFGEFRILRNLKIINRN